VTNVEPLDEAIQAVIGARTLEENLAAFRAQGVTAGPVYDIAQFLADPHVRAREMIVELPDADHGTVAMHAPTPRLAVTPGALRHTGPALGAHNAEVYARIGIDALALAKLAEDGVV
jgi:crotonobetainyl-CoA:carnitine CoA-transferase CaiB-like acyl-CoA transferase